MIQTEQRIFREYLLQQQPQFDEYRTEISIVSNSPMNTETSEGHSAIWRQLTAPRVDAICVRRGKIYLLEVEVELHWQAVAQAILYRELWQIVWPHLKLEATIVLCQTTRADIAETAKSLGIDVVVVTI